MNGLLMRKLQKAAMDHTYRDGDNLVMYAWSGYPSAGVTNGKLYQTVKLEACTYRFDISVSFIERLLNGRGQPGLTISFHAMCLESPNFYLLLLAV